MTQSESHFLRTLETLSKDQARIESSSPLPEGMRPMAAVVGRKPWQVLLATSFIVSACVSTFAYPFISRLFEAGVLAWLLR